jgi:transcriptional regulator with XRE-family HTH domain
MTTAERIDRILQEKGLSRRQIAIKADIPPSTFQSAMARGDSFSTDMIQKIAAALGVSAAYLLNEENEIIPGRLKIIRVNDPGSEDIAYKIEAADEEAYKQGLEIFKNAGVDVSPKKRLDAAFEALNEQGRSVAALRVEELTKIPDYQKK